MSDSSPRGGGRTGGRDMSSRAAQIVPGRDERCPPAACCAEEPRRRRRAQMQLDANALPERSGRLLAGREVVVLRQRPGRAARLWRRFLSRMLCMLSGQARLLSQPLHLQKHLAFAPSASLSRTRNLAGPHRRSLSCNPRPNCAASVSGCAAGLRELTGPSPLYPRPTLQLP